MGTSLSFSQLRGQEETKQKVPRRYGVLYHWLWELFCVSVAFACLGSIAGILIYFDGEIVPEWRYSLTLNAIVAILSTVARAALAIVLAEIISQEKWTWFTEKPRPLQHLQRFDHASRSIWGSAGLIGNLRFGIRGHGLAIIASVATILSVAVGPFSQQAVKSVLCPIEVSEVQASIPLAPWVPGEDAYLFPSFEMSQLGSRVQAAMISSLSEDSPSNRNGTVTLRTTCETGNCSFPETHGIAHSTVGLCSKCVETTHLVDLPEYKDDNTTLGPLTIRLRGSVVGEWFPWLAVGESNFSQTLETDGPPALADLAPFALANITVLTASKAKCNNDNKCPQGRYRFGDDVWTAQHEVLATSCAVHLCRKDVKAYVEGGRLVDYGPMDEDSHEAYGEPLAFGGKRSYVDEDYFPINNDWVSFKSPCLVNGTRYDFDASIKPENISRPVPGRPYWAVDNKEIPAQCVYGVDWRYYEGLRTFIAGKLLRESCTENPHSNGTSVFCRDSWWLRHLYRNGNATFESIREAFQTLATSTTNFWRNDGWGEGQTMAQVGLPVFFDDGSESPPYEMDKMLIGVTNQTAVCVQLDWLWLLLPTSLALITLALLAAMIVCNYCNDAQPVWKSDLLPLLFYRPTIPLDMPGTKASEDLNVLHEHARTVHVQFTHGDSATRSGFVVPSEQGSPQLGAEQTEMDTLLGEGSEPGKGIQSGRDQWQQPKSRVSIARKPVSTASVSP